MTNADLKIVLDVLNKSLRLSGEDARALTAEIARRVTSSGRVFSSPSESAVELVTHAEYVVKLKGTNE